MLQFDNPISAYKLLSRLTQPQALLNEPLERVVDEGKPLFYGPANHPTIEGPKIYKRDGYYYIVAPAGRVIWQITFGDNGTRSRMDSLRSWTDEEETRYYSGLATYEKTFETPAGLYWSDE